MSSNIKSWAPRDQHLTKLGAFQLSHFSLAPPGCQAQERERELTSKWRLCCVLPTQYSIRGRLPTYDLQVRPPSSLPRPKLLLDPDDWKFGTAALARSPLSLSFPPSPSLSSCETISSQRASKRSRSQSVVGKMLSKTTELAKKVCPRLRDLVTAPARGITQPRTNLIREPCTYVELTFSRS